MATRLGYGAHPGVLLLTPVPPSRTNAWKQSVWVWRYTEDDFAAIQLFPRASVLPIRQAAVRPAPPGYSNPSWNTASAKAVLPR